MCSAAALSARFCAPFCRPASLLSASLDKALGGAPSGNGGGGKGRLRKRRNSLEAVWSRHLAPLAGSLVPLAAATEQLRTVAAVVMEGLPQPSLNGEY